MLINTKHIVMYDDAASDFGRIANMVDDDGAVLIIKDGRPAYAVVPFAEVQEQERPASGSIPKTEAPKPAAEPTCGCGKPQSQCGCGGHGGASGGCGGHGGHGHGRGGHSRGGFGGFGVPNVETIFTGRGGQHYAEHFGHGGDAGHLHPDTEPDAPESDWDFEFHAGPGFDPLFQRDPNFSMDEFIGKMPPEMVEAGKRFVSQLSPLIGLFGSGSPFGSGGSTTTPVDDPDTK